MKKKIIIILTFMPFLALAQSNFYNKIFGNRYLTTENRFEKHLIWRASNDLERHIETTLINDTRYYKSVLNFDLDKSNNLSFTVKNDKLLDLLDNHKLDEMLLEGKSLKDFKWKFRKPIETKSLFENLYRNN